MPHIIVEYPENLIEKLDIDMILKTIHSSVSASGLFAESHIKTRAYGFKNYTNAGTSKPYIHIQARIKSGRDADNKKNLSDVIILGLSEVNIPVAVLTVEIIDMDRASYGKLTS